MRKSSDEDLDENANEDASKVVSDDEDSQPSAFDGPDYFVYMHYPNLAMLQKSTEYGHCQSCYVLMHSLRSHRNLEEFLDQAQELEAQRLQRLKISGDLAHLAILDEDESDPNLDSALKMHVEVYDSYGLVGLSELSLSPEEYGEGRIFLTFGEARIDHEFIQGARLSVFRKPISESSDSGRLESEVSFLASPGECEAFSSVICPSSDIGKLIILIRHLIIAHLSMYFRSHTFAWYANGWVNVNLSTHVAMIREKSPCRLSRIV